MILTLSTYCPVSPTIMDSVSGTINQNIFCKFLWGMVFYHSNRKKKTQNQNTLRYNTEQDPKQEKSALPFDNLLYCSTRKESTHTRLSQLHKSDITHSPSIARKAPSPFKAPALGGREIKLLVCVKCQEGKPQDMRLTALLFLRGQHRTMDVH